MIKDIHLVLDSFNFLLLGKDFDDLLINLTSSELRVYLTIYSELMAEEVAQDCLSNSVLAKMLNVSTNTIVNAKTSLKKKGYLLIVIKDKTTHVLLDKESIEGYLKHHPQ